MTVREAAKSSGEPAGFRAMRPKFKSIFYHETAGKARQDYLSKLGFPFLKRE